jgi:uncharacterized protein (TIGR02145 family)
LSGNQPESGKKSYKIRPVTVTAAELALDPWYDRSSNIEFIVNNGVSGVLKKTITLRHFFYNAFAETAPAYLMDGSTGNTFTIKSNVDFTLEIASEPGNNPTAGNNNPVVTLNDPSTTVYPANTAGTDITFDIANDIINPTVMYTEVKLIIKSPDGLFADKEVTLPCATCGVNGVAVPWAIGTNGYTNNSGAIGRATYLTHQYGGKCWMVQNSREGTPAWTTYSGKSPGERGYYYAYTTVNACPAGWHKPTYAEVLALINVVNATGNLNTNNGGSQFWAGSTFTTRAGSYANSALDWHGWDAHDCWWYGSDATNFSGTNTLYDSGGGYSAYFRTVRCVRD